MDIIRCELYVDYLYPTGVQAIPSWTWFWYYNEHQASEYYWITAWDSRTARLSNPPGNSPNAEYTSNKIFKYAFPFYPPNLNWSAQTRMLTHQSMNFRWLMELWHLPSITVEVQLLPYSNLMTDSTFVMESGMKYTLLRYG